MRHRKDWERSECNHCQHYSDECRRGVVSGIPIINVCRVKNMAENSLLFLIRKSEFVNK